MKRPQKNFVVEYKSGSRRQPQKPTSIWGDLDLKSISRDVDIEARLSNEARMPAREPAKRDGDERNEVEPLTEAPQKPKTARPTQEELMADESNPVTTEGDVQSMASSVPEPKKRRGPRAKNKSLYGSESSSVGSAVMPETKPAKTQRAKNTKSQASGPEVATKQSRKPRAPKFTAPTNSSTSGDDFADLLQLEEENRSLRKQLAEKLRAENADLRRRLGHA